MPRLSVLAVDHEHRHEHRHHDAHDHEHGHSHGLIDPSITRSREGIRAASLSLAVLGLAALARRRCSFSAAASRCWPI
jgi:ABC-type Zn2+ transport system substrate-binding protein/surface adhesin